MSGGNPEGYFKEYYARPEVKTRLSTTRKNRYATDPVYREKMKKKAADRRAEKREKPPEGYTQTMQMVAEALGISQDTLRDWGKRGYYPEPKKACGRLWMTGPQLELLTALKKYLDEMGHGDSVEGMVSMVYANW